MTGVEFDDLRWLNLLWAALAVAALGVYALWQRRRAMRQFASPNLLGRLTAPVGWTRPIVRLVLQLLCLVALTAAIIHPRWGQAQERMTTRGIDVMVLLDVSRSMLARDIAPNRLERAKLSIESDLLPALGGDRIGLITFAGLPKLKCPLTHDYGYFRLVLDDVDVYSSPRGGTLIGDAIRKAGDAFDDTRDTQKLVLLITDGEDHESYPVEAARTLWTEKHIPIVTIALGDERDGARIPIDSNGKEQFLTHDDKIVWSKANFDDLRRIAAVSGLNAFAGVGTKNFNLGEIYERVAGALETQQRNETQRTERPSRYHPFTVLALAFLLLDSCLREGPKRAGTSVAIRNEQKEAAA